MKYVGEVFKPNLMTLFLYYNGSAVRSEGLKEIQVNLIYIGVLQSKVTSNLVSPSFDSFLQKPYVPENAIKYFFFFKAVVHHYNVYCIYSYRTSYRRWS